MKKLEIYGKSHSVEDWEKIIRLKFYDIPLSTRGDDIYKILGTDDKEKKIINEVSLLIYGKDIGVLSFEDACNKMQISNVIQNIPNEFVAGYKLKIIIKALNEGWVPDWNDSNQLKYFNYFTMNGGFSYSDTDLYRTTYTSVPSALLFKTEALAIYCGKQFGYLFEEYYKQIL
jgi:hypothetical protein